MSCRLLLLRLRVLLLFLLLFMRLLLLRLIVLLVFFRLGLSLFHHMLRDGVLLSMRRLLLCVFLFFFC